MSSSTLRPDNTIANTGALTGAASAATAVSDDTDASYITFDFGEAASFDFGALTLPAGAVISFAVLRARTARVTATSVLRYTLGIPGSEVTSTSTVSISWTTATTTALTTVYETETYEQPFTDADADAATASFTHTSGSGQIRLYEAYLDVYYVTQPTLTVDAPTSTVSDTNQPTIEWTPTLDADGGAQGFYEVKVYTDAQYLAGGFDPDTTSPTVGTEDDAGFNLDGTIGSGTSWEVTSPLADDTYRAYVRVAQTVNGDQHWSEWAYTEFTVSVLLPAVPSSFTAAPDSTNARFALDALPTTGNATTDRIELQRSLDGGTTWEQVRTVDGDGLVYMPHVVDVGTYAATADNTTHALVLPDPNDGIQANDILIAFAAADGNPSMSWPAGWTEIKDEAGNGSAVRAGVAWYRAAGGESGTITLTLTASEGVAARILCVRHASTSTAPEVSTGVSASGANGGDPDSLNPANWGSEPTLWIAAMANDGDVAVTAGPASYSSFGNTRWANASGAGISTAAAMLQTTSQNPGAFTHAAEDIRAFTVGVRGRNATISVSDYEAPNGTAMQYRARTAHNYNGAWAVSAWSTDTDTWSSSAWWLKHPHQPALNMEVRVRSLASETRAGRMGVFQPLGATTAVVVSDTRGPKTGVLVLRTDSTTEQDDLDALLDEHATLLLQAPATDSSVTYIRVGSHTRARVVDHTVGGARRWDELEYVEVGSPPGDVVEWP